MIGAADAEAMKIRAQALSQFNDAAVLSQVLEVMPEFARLVAQPLSRTSEIIINSSTNEATVANGINSFLAQVPASVKALSGIDLNAFMSGKMAPSDAPVKVSVWIAGNFGHLAACTATVSTLHWTSLTDVAWAQHSGATPFTTTTELAQCCLILLWRLATVNFPYTINASPLYIMHCENCFQTGQLVILLYSATKYLKCFYLVLIIFIFNVVAFCFQNYSLIYFFLN